MIRTFQYTIQEGDNALTIGEYLRDRGYSHHIIAKLKRTEHGITKNDVWARTSEILSSGDRLCIQLEDSSPSEHIQAVPMDLKIVYEDEDLLVIDKPADTPVHPSIHNYENTLANGIAWYFQRQGIPFIYRCINRLDRDTSGLLLIAKHSLSASILSDDMRNRRITRTYLAIVKGNIDRPGTVEAPIGRKDGSAIARCIDYESGEPAVTHYFPVSYSRASDLSLISLRLETGRTHQIRVHMKHIGHALIGDFLYCPEYDYISRQALHSWRLTFVHPITKERLTFEAPLPEDMRFI